MNRLSLVIILFLYSCISNAYDIEWYDIKDKSVLQVTCDGKEHKLVIKTSEIVKKQKEIDQWFEKVIIICNF